MVDRGVARGDLAAAVEAAVRGGVDWVQLRDRELEGAALLALADELAAALRRGSDPGRPARLLVNRRVDVALAAGADGVHLGFDAMTVAQARAVLPPGATVGISAHAPDEVARAPSGTDYAHLAPVFPPLSKTPAEARAAVGLEALGAAARSGLPVLAQGGIDAGNAAAARAAGASGVAVTGAILLGEAPGRAAAALREALDA